MRLTITAVQALLTKDTVQFRVLGSDIKDLQVQVFDLRGRSVYQSNWNGSAVWTLQNQKGQRVAHGVYLYLITVRGLNGDVAKTKLQMLLVK
ncbi:MAG: gliding motility-associated C-terminal domain-containing protein [Nitrospirae bacterium]|nr:gliding motility-associated C-terminal domain-containing protein [Nitrospirota bacterium]